MSTVKVTNLQHASSASPNIVLDSSGNATMAGSMAMATPFGMRNKIINGAMQIDQRNAGASTTPTTTGYVLDRYGVFLSQASKFSVQQNAGSVTPPAGFSYYMGFTSSSAYSIGASEIFGFAQCIEAFNINDLAWGTASAKTCTLSFWVRSSLTGQFGGFLKNGGIVVGGSYNNYYYPFSYTINASNTWEYKTVTITAPTSGSWETGNGPGVTVAWSLGAGTTVTGGSGWGSTFYNQPSGSTNLVATNGATLYITGIQFEVGSVATPFERRMYSNELILCQRYYAKSYAQSVVPATNTEAGLVQTMNGQDGNQIGGVRWKVTMRSAPTVAVWSKGGTAGSISNTSYANAPNAGSWVGYDVGDDGCRIIVGTGGLTAASAYNFHYTASSEL